MSELFGVDDATEPEFMCACQESCRSFICFVINGSWKDLEETTPAKPTHSPTIRKIFEDLRVVYVYWLVLILLYSLTYLNQLQTYRNKEISVRFLVFPSLLNFLWCMYSSQFLYDLANKLYLERLAAFNRPYQARK